MIKYTQDSAIRDLPEYGVLVHPVNCEAKMNFGMMQSVAKQFKDWYMNYRGYCRWFFDGHEDEIIGTFHRYETDDKRIICSFFCQKSAAKTRDIDYELWHQFLSKIDRQTVKANKAGLPWQLHIDSKIFTTDGEEDDMFKDMLNDIFACSSTILWIHES